VVLFLSEPLRQGQRPGLMQHLNQRLTALEQWKQQLAKPRSGPRTQPGFVSYSVGSTPQLSPRI